jgi:DNA-binding PadR family transcriptional regulator
MHQMAQRKRQLTELEGAALSVIERLKACTPYQVRQAFLTSPSTEWSGSAGAVYPAIRRLKAAGLLAAKPAKDARRTVHYRLSALGVAALAGWLCDVGRATGLGLDPFRTRAPLWGGLPTREAVAFRRQLIRALKAERAALRNKLAAPDEPDRAAMELCLALQDMRLAWLAAKRKA